LISASAVEKITALIDGAVAAGGRISHQATLPVGSRGHFLAPTVLVDVPPDAEVVQKEIFGPVAPIVSWTDEAEKLGLVNSTEMGLAAYVFAGELQRALRIGEAVDCGIVGVKRSFVDYVAPCDFLRLLVAFCRSMAHFGWVAVGSDADSVEHLELAHMSVSTTFAVIVRR
jgi:acyl-CoA reductase-like NAD-dependent aldehyde dehydrogenase